MNPLLFLALSLLLTEPGLRNRLGSRGGNPTAEHPARSGFPGSPRLFGFITALSLVGLLFLLVGQITVAISAAVITLTVGWAIRSIRSGRRASQRAAATAGFLGQLLGELRAGAAMPQAVSEAVNGIAETAPAALVDTLRLTAARTTAGGSGAAVLLDTSHHAPELRELAKLWRIAERHGIPLTPLIEQAQARLDARARHRTATVASLQGPQATAVVLTLLPLAGVVMGTAMGADPLGLLFGGGLGGLLLVLGTSLTCAGYAWSRRIITGATR